MMSNEPSRCTLLLETTLTIMIYGRFERTSGLARDVGPRSWIHRLVSNTVPNGFEGWRVTRSGNRQMARNEQLFIDGEWHATGSTISVADHTNEGTFARVAAATESDATAALGAAERARTAMGELTVVERATKLERIAKAIEMNREALAAVIVREAGKPIGSARGEVDSAAERARRAAAEIRDRTGEFREGSTEGHEGWEAIVRQEPIGTVLCIGPYNYPLSTVAFQVAAALAAGNSIIVKPSSKAPVSAAMLVRSIVENVDLPDGALNYVPGSGAEIGETLTGDDRIDAIAMTGSSAAGERIARESGIVRLHLELGGNAPAIVFPDADVEAAASDCAAGSLKFAGQRCSAISRVLVHESIHDELVEHIAGEMDRFRSGDLFDEETNFGPLIDESQAVWVETLVEDAIGKGADLVEGGTRDGPLFEPTLLADVPGDAGILYEEQFGPVAAVTAFGTESAALELANADDYALDAAIFTRDHERALRMADRIEAGGVRINGAPSHGLGDVPFGGSGASGIGREGIGFTIEELSKHKSIVL